MHVLKIVSSISERSVWFFKETGRFGTVFFFFEKGNNFCRQQFSKYSQILESFKKWRHPIYILGRFFPTGCRFFPLKVVPIEKGSNFFF